MHKRYILVCERGWRGIRDISLDLAGKNIPSTVLIRGLPEGRVRKMITPHKGINNVFIPEKFFTPFIFIYVILAMVLSPGRKLSIFLSKDKTYGRMRVFKKIFPHIELTNVHD